MLCTIINGNLVDTVTNQILDRPVIVMDGNDYTFMACTSKSSWNMLDYVGRCIVAVGLEPLDIWQQCFVINEVSKNNEGFNRHLIDHVDDPYIKVWIKYLMNKDQYASSKPIHSQAVAAKMRELAPLYGLDPDKMSVLGMLHDIGYTLTDKSENHGFIGGEHLKSTINFPYWKEVYWHGMYPCPYSSPALDLLNYADLTTSPMGEDVTVDERIYEIGCRCGFDSLKYVMAKELANQTKLPDPPPLK